MTQSGLKIFNAQAMLQQGITLFQQGNIRKSIEIAEELIKRDANNDEAYHLKGVALYTSKEFSKSEFFLRKAISLNSKKSYYYNSLGLILSEQKKFAESIDILKNALRLDPNNVVIYNSLGVSYKELELYEQAQACYDTALRLNPNFATTYMNIGVLGIFTEKYEKAMEWLKHAEKLEPANPLIFNNMAACARKQGFHDKSVEYNRKALELKPDLYESWNNLCATLYEMGEYEKAVEEYTKMLEKFPSDGAKIDLMLLTKQMPETSEEINEIRKRLNQNLDILLNDKNLRLKDPVKDLQHMHFFHAYHGRNDKEIMQKFAKLHEQVCPELCYIAEHCKNYKPPENRKIRVGFISSYFYTHIVSKFFNEPIARLAQDNDFEVIAFSPAIRYDESSKYLASKIDKFIRVPFDLSKAREIIARHKCDIIAYTDIGMNLFTYFMGFARLAPVQCVLSGHPITTGIRNIDYYISTKIVEPENAQEHYTEKLVTFNSNIAIHPKVDYPAKKKTRRDLGLPEGDNIRLYSCPVLPHKIHPDFDQTIKDILEKDNKAIFILFRLEQEIVKLLPDRLAKKLPPELMKRIIFQPFLKHDDYKNFLMNMDCVVDPFHFTMGSTAFLVFGLDVPLVTLPGEFMRGRAAYWLYKKMGIDDLIAENQKDYVNLAVKLANNPDFRNSVSERIKQNKHLLYEDYSSLDELKVFFQRVVTDFNQLTQGASW